jgi:hypothetical protein
MRSGLRSFPLTRRACRNTHDAWDHRIGADGAGWIVRYDACASRVLIAVLLAATCGVTAALVPSLRIAFAVPAEAFAVLAVCWGCGAVRAVHRAGRAAANWLGATDANGSTLHPPVRGGAEFFDQWLRAHDAPDGWRQGRR